MTNTAPTFEELLAWRRDYIAKLLAQPDTGIDDAEAERERREGIAESRWEARRNEEVES
jgi:hypothetical protein